MLGAKWKRIIKSTYLINFIRGHNRSIEMLNFRIRKWKPCFSWICQKVEDWLRLFSRPTDLYQQIYTKRFIPTDSYQKIQTNISIPKIHTNRFIPTNIYQQIYTNRFIPPDLYHRYIPLNTYQQIHTLMLTPSPGP